MAMKDYSDEFRADAVALYESTPGATLWAGGQWVAVPLVSLRMAPAWPCL